jgi:hypothetical protein
MSPKFPRPGIAPPEKVVGPLQSTERDYWNGFYRQKNTAILEASSFARDCVRLTPPGRGFLVSVTTVRIQHENPIAGPETRLSKS